ncbi:hypothetical protein EHP00_893 [Ecytonucleospora hepatopenaei]|uniref:Uncharacterized protein n=1 Tax=Ecytonucleospora hepatopenaei TaxID=646526 RepID=A0A1W0E3V9_9MICR|nr:hypothetical protein EHP00_893 [Ecytonucleospora hepatopenaei]
MYSVMLISYISKFFEAGSKFISIMSFSLLKFLQNVVLPAPAVPNTKIALSIRVKKYFYQIIKKNTFI